MIMLLIFLLFSVEINAKGKSFSSSPVHRGNSSFKTFKSPSVSPNAKSFVPPKKSTYSSYKSKENSQHKISSNNHPLVNRSSPVTKPYNHSPSFFSNPINFLWLYLFGIHISTPIKEKMDKTDEE